MWQKFAWIGALVSGAMALIRWAVKDVTDAAKQAGRDEIIKAEQQAENEAIRRVDDVLSERRTVDDATRKLSDGNF